MSSVANLLDSLSPTQRWYGAMALTAVATSGLTALLCKHAARGRLPCAAKTADAGKVIDSHSKSSDIYESEASARQYMEFHYTPSRESFAHKLRLISEAYDFPARLAMKFKLFTPENPTGAPLRGLDIGCATGASVFAMSELFAGGVVGMDFSEVFIHLAKEVAERGAQRRPVHYTAPVQGDLREARAFILPPKALPERCHFYAGDAMNMFAEDGTPLPTTASACYPEVTYWQAKAGEMFDGVLCLNLIDRVPDPRRLLRSLARLMTTGGVLVLADPYSWWEDATPKERWIGGTNEERSEPAVKALLAENFNLLSETDEAFLIRDHIRHYQIGFSHCTVWRRK